MHLFVLLISLTFTFSAFASNNAIFDSYRMQLRQMTLKNHHPLNNYGEARVHLFGTLHLKRDSKGYYVQDVYCGTKYRKKVGPGSVPNHEQVNTEHTWPQSRFNRGENKYHQKADLHHLFPTDSRANSTRGNYNFADLNGGRSAHSGCPLSQVGTIPGTSRDGFEPPEAHKGNVARALFYFSLRYDIPIADFEEIVLRQWNWLDPVDDEERARNAAIELIQGNRNPFVDDADLAELISDF
jgi:deoxyribonuclease-1